MSAWHNSWPQQAAPGPARKKKKSEFWKILNIFSPSPNLKIKINGKQNSTTKISPIKISKLMKMLIMKSISKLNKLTIKWRQR